MTLHHRSPANTPSGRVGVVGSRGFVGSAVVAALRKRGADLEPVSSSDVDLLADGSTEALTRRLAGCDTVVLVSAIAPARELDTVAADLRMAAAFSDAVAGLEIDHVVAISSDAVYGDDQAVVSEADAPAPTSLHGAMHMTRELALRQRFGSALCVLRPTLLYGEDDPHDGYGPNRFLRAAAAGREIKLFGEGEEQRDHLLVDDLGALVTAVCGRRSVGTLNVATGRSASFREAAELCVRLTGSSSPIEGSPRQNPVTHRHFDVAARLAAFPELAVSPLEEGLAIVAARRGHG